jgi:hypothetical protein
MEVLLFQWGQVFKNHEWQFMIDAWFGRFKISINLNIFYYINSISLLILIFFLFYYRFHSWVWGDFKPTSWSSDSPSCYSDRMIHYWGGWPSSIVHGTKITCGWCMCSPLLTPRSKQRPSSSSSNASILN